VHCADFSTAPELVPSSYFLIGAPSWRELIARILIRARCR